PLAQRPRGELVPGTRVTASAAVGEEDDRRGAGRDHELALESEGRDGDRLFDRGERASSAGRNRHGTSPMQFSRLVRSRPDGPAWLFFGAGAWGTGPPGAPHGHTPGALRGGWDHVRWPDLYAQRVP